MAAAVFDRLHKRLLKPGLAWSGAGLQAAVLVALTDEPEPRVILSRRAQHLRLHPGEVAFPGGKREPEDVSPWATAIREAGEEIGIEPELVIPVGDLQPLITRSKFEVHPCIAIVPPKFDMVVDSTELESVFMTPIAELADPKNYRLEEMVDQGERRWVPHYQINDDNIWGVTARVLVQLVNIAVDACLPVTPHENLTGK